MNGAMSSGLAAWEIQPRKHREPPGREAGHSSDWRSAVYVHEELYELLQKAFDGSDIPWADCFREDRGDGALIVVPPYITCCSACWSRGRSSARSRAPVPNWR